MQVAIIDNNLCIGCTKCIAACPIDAIIGAQNQMHTVILNECIGCKLCIAPCPVDCISMQPITNLLPPEQIADKTARAKTAKKRHKDRLHRLKSEQTKSTLSRPQQTELQDTLHRIKLRLQKPHHPS